MVNLKINVSEFAHELVKSQEDLSIEVPSNTTLPQIEKMLRSWLFEKKRYPNLKIVKIELKLESVIGPDGQMLPIVSWDDFIRKNSFSCLMRSNPQSIKFKMKFSNVIGNH